MNRKLDAITAIARYQTCPTVCPFAQGDYYAGPAIDWSAAADRTGARLARLSRAARRHRLDTIRATEARIAIRSAMA